MGNNKSKSIILGAVVALAGSFLFGNIFFNHPAYATFSASISRSGTVNLAEAGSSTIRPTSAGTLGTGSDTVSVTTNCTYGGYKLYVSATSSGGTALKLADDSDSIPTSSTAVGSETTLSRDTWGVGKTASAFAGLQAYSEDVGKLTPFYAGVTSDSYTFYYGVNVSTAKTPGTYTGEVLYTVLMDEACTKYTLNFDGNNATTNNLTSQDLDFDATIDLAEISSSDKIARIGYTLTGWQDQDGNAYGITGTANVNPNNKSTVTLTAIWEEDVVIATMQAWAASNGCNALATNQYLTLKDARDGEEYVVKKLADGKCWMVQNLRLVGERKLTSEDSDVSADFNLTASTPDPDTTNWCATLADVCVYNNTQVYYNPAEASDPTKSSYYGALYNWYTATAGTGTPSIPSGDVPSSICPKGWRLPRSDSNKTTNDFSILDIALGGTGENRTDANTYDVFTGDYSSGNNGSFGLAGLINGSVAYVGQYGLYWSSTSASLRQAHIFDLRSGDAWVYLRDANNKYAGQSVRCIARDTRSLSDITYMQDINSDIVYNTATNTYKQLTDKRDNNKYYVKKLADGRLWMVQNLRLVGERKLTSEDSDVSSDFTITASDNNKGWCTTNDSTCQDKPLVYYDSTKTSVASDVSYYGAVYNWYTATAGTGTYSTGANAAVSSSICPKWWRLPKGGTNITINEFSVLDVAWGGTGENRKNANTYETFTGPYPTSNNGGFNLGGYFLGVSSSIGLAGDYWSSTAYNSDMAYYLGVGSEPNFTNYVEPKLGNNKYSGFSIRCIAK